MNRTLQELNMKDVLNAYVANIPEDNPVEYFDKMYASINPGAMMYAIEQAKIMVEAENTISSKSKKNTENANVYVTLGGESMTQSFYTGVIAALMWLPKYIEESASRLKVSQTSIDTTLGVLRQCQLPQIHDVKEELIGGNKVSVEPSSLRYYSAFLSSIVSWLNSGVNDFKVSGVMKTNMEMCRYLSATAIGSFPSVPFACYHVGNCKTNDIFALSEKMGKSFDWTEFMTDECYVLNEPKFVVASDNAPVVGIIGHPLTETFIAEIKEGQSKWVGLFVESEEFSKLCAQNGLTTDMIKKYIINNSPEQHSNNLAKKDVVATFIEGQKLTKQCFNMRHEFSSVDKKGLGFGEYDL